MATVATLREQRKGKNNNIEWGIKEGASDNIVKESLTDRTMQNVHPVKAEDFAYQPMTGFCI